MNLFRLDASIRTHGSHSRQIADLVEHEWTDVHPESRIIRRPIGTEPLPSDAWASAAYAAYAAFTPEDQRTQTQIDALGLAAALVDELVEADALLFAVPLYNFGVSQHFKTYVDLVTTDPRMAAGGSPALIGKPAVLVTVRGGAYGSGTPREGWDHATPWMRRILEDVWQLDVRTVEAEFTLVGVNPALDEFRDLAAQMREDAEATARSHGRALASHSSIGAEVRDQGTR
jgi:FMN-dependent NADH-azoreductase